MEERQSCTAATSRVEWAGLLGWGLQCAAVSLVIGVVASYANPQGNLKWVVGAVARCAPACAVSAMVCGWMATRLSGLAQIVLSTAFLGIGLSLLEVSGRRWHGGELAIGVTMLGVGGLINGTVGARHDALRWILALLAGCAIYTMFAWPVIVRGGVVGRMSGTPRILYGLPMALLALAATPPRDRMRRAGDPASRTRPPDIS